MSANANTIKCWRFFFELVRAIGIRSRNLSLRVLPWLRWCSSRLSAKTVQRESGGLGPGAVAMSNLSCPRNGKQSERLCSSSHQYHWVLGLGR